MPYFLARCWLSAKLLSAPVQTASTSSSMTHSPLTGLPMYAGKGKRARDLTQSCGQFHAAAPGGL